MLRRMRYLQVMEDLKRVSIPKADLAQAMFAMDTDSQLGAQKRMQRLYDSSSELQRVLDVLGYKKRQKHLTMAQAVVMNADGLTGSILLLPYCPHWLEQSARKQLQPLHLFVSKNHNKKPINMKSYCAVAHPRTPLP